MKDMGIVQGSAAQAQELVVGKDTVYVHTDIELVSDQDEHGNPVEHYRYHEIQYDKDEYIKILAVQNNELNALMNAILGVNE